MGDITLTGSILEEVNDITLEELAGISSCEVEWIVELVEEGIIEPRGREHTEWRFSGTCLLRVRTALRLQQDLNINIEGIALVIDLMEELNELKSRLRVLDSL